MEAVRAFVRHRSALARRGRAARRRAGDERVRRATFYIDNELLEELDLHCRNNGLNKSEFVRDAIRNQLR